MHYAEGLPTANPHKTGAVLINLGQVLALKRLLVRLILTHYECFSGIVAGACLPLGWHFIL